MIPERIIFVSRGITVYILIYTLRFKEKSTERRWWSRQLYTSREVYSGSSLLADLNFQSVSELYKNFTRTFPSELEFLINLIGEKISKKDTVFRNAISVQERFALTHSSTGLFISFASSFPCILLSHFVKMHWVFWAPNYFFSFTNFDKFYATFLSPLHFTITKTFKKPHSTTD